MTTNRFSILFVLLFSLPPGRNSDPGSHSRLFSLPTPVRALHFYREKTSALSSLVDSRRIVLTHARRSRQLILVIVLQLNPNSHHGGIQTPRPTLVAFDFTKKQPNVQRLFVKSKKNQRLDVKSPSQNHTNTTVGCQRSFENQGEVCNRQMATRYVPELIYFWHASCGSCRFHTCPWSSDERLTINGCIGMVLRQRFQEMSKLRLRIIPIQHMVVKSSSESQEV